MNQCFFLSFAIAIIAPALSFPAVLTVTNPTKETWRDAPVIVTWDKANKPLPRQAVSSDGKRIPLQCDDLDGGNSPYEMVFPFTLKPGEIRKFTLSSDAPLSTPVSRAHAGMFLKTDAMKGMEGPGWESDRVAYRIYWDKRNATDVFSKTQPILSLEAFAAKDLDYHYLSKWGVDTLHVGPAVGIGGFGVWQDGKIEKVVDAKRDFKLLADGPYRAVCDFIYTDWKVGERKYDLTARMSICAGQSWGQCDLRVKSLDHKPVPEFVAGYVRHDEETTLIKDDKAGIIGRWGNQALGNGQQQKGGNLGLGVVADPSTIAAIGEDADNDYIRLKAARGIASYRYLSNWFKEPDAATSTGEFKEMLKLTAAMKPEVRIER